MYTHEVDICQRLTKWQRIEGCSNLKHGIWPDTITTQREVYVCLGSSQAPTICETNVTQQLHKQSDFLIPYYKLV